MRREERLNDGEEAARTAQDAHQARLWTALPGIIESWDDDAGTVTVQPSIQGRILNRNPTTGEVVEQLANLPLLIHVPIVWPQCAAGALTFPLTQGDEVLVTFSARAIDSWWQSGGIGAPIEKRMHDLSDGFAHVGVTSQPRRLPNVSTENIQLRNFDGDVFYELTPAGKCRVVATDNAEIVAGGDVTVQAEGSIELTAAEDVTIAAGGDVTITAGGAMTVTAPGKITLNGIVWDDHIHGSSPGPSNP